MSESNHDDSVVSNASDVKQVRAARKRERFTARQRRDWWRKVSSMPEGVAVIREMLEQCGVWRGGFTAERAHFNEGQRNVGLFIIAKVSDANPNALLEIMVRDKAKEQS